MSTSARDLISSSLRLIGVLASGESVASNEATDGLNALNAMLDSWSNESLMIPNKVREVFPLVVGQQSYTMGPAGNFNTTRPVRIENALIQLTTNNPVTELSMKLLTKDEYAGIIIKTNQSTFPLYLYAEGTYPAETLNVWPVPSAINNLALYTSKQLLDLTSLTSTFSVPPGYERAIRFNLAVDLAPEYGKAMREDVVAIAAQSKSDIKRLNSKPQYLRVDDALKAKAATWNWRTGEPT